MVQCIITVLCNVHTLVGGILYTVFYFMMQCSVQCSAPYSAVGWCEVEYHVCMCIACAGVPCVLEVYHVCTIQRSAVRWYTLCSVHRVV